MDEMDTSDICVKTRLMENQVYSYIGGVRIISNMRPEIAHV